MIARYAGTLVAALFALLPSRVDAASAANDRMAVSAKNDQTFDIYLQWKLKYLRQGNCGDNERYINSLGDAGDEGDITVSEAHGYGMRALVTMADRDPDAHADFDRMVNLLLRSRVSNDIPLMTWRLTSSCAPAAHEPSAPDGDMDMAYALLDAEARWGNDARHDYGALAREIIQAEMAHVVQEADGPHPIIGLWEDMDKDDEHFGGTRLSDYMMQHFARFEQATGDARWHHLADSGYRLFDKLQKRSLSGLLPDFAIVQGEHVKKAPKNFLEGALDGGFGYNACRVPWRLAAAYKGTHDARAKALLVTLATALNEVSGHDPHLLYDGYRLSGWQVGTKTDRLAFVAPAAAAMSVLPEFAEQAPAWQAASIGTKLNGQGYFNETVRLMTLLF